MSHSAADNLKRYYGWNYQDIKDVLNPPGGWSKTNKDIILLFCIAIGSEIMYNDGVLMNNFV